MALKYSCPHCGEEVIAQYLKPGEPSLCNSCRKYAAVPENAINVDYKQPKPVSEFTPDGLPNFKREPVVGELADRGTRLGAALIDGGLVSALYLIFFVTMLIFGEEDAMTALVLIFMILAVLALSIVQLHLLITAGQTLGKKWLKIKIVKFPTGENGGFVTNVLLRSFVNGLIGAVPFIGIVYALVDVLFIFTDDRRCIHDLIASTVVVKVKQPGLKDYSQHMDLQQQI